MEETKRTRRRITKEEKIANIQAEISKHEAKIADLKKKISDLDKPPIKMKDVNAKIKSLGLSPEEVLKAIEKLSK